MRSPLYDEICKLPVIDVHTHFETLTETFGYTMPQYLYYGCFFGCYHGHFAPADEACLESGSGTVREQFAALLRMWEKLRDTRTGRLCSHMVSLIDCRMDMESFEPLCRWYAGWTPDSIRKMTPAIRTFICNSAGHPLYGGIPGLRSFLDGGRKADEGMLRTLNLTELHSISTLGQLHDIEQLTGQSITDLASWADACQKLLQDMIRLGIVAFKDVYLYFRAPQIDYPDDEAAQREMDAFLRGGAMTRNLQNTMMFRLYEMAAGTGLPMQIHTGAVIETAETANYLLDLMKLIRSFPQMQFDLLHLNYPALESYFTVLRSCPNAWGDTTWAFTVDPGYTKRYLDWVLDADVPQRHCLFGSDRHNPGLTVATMLDVMRDLLSQWLGERVASGYLSQSSAMELARMWLYENPKTLFHLDSKLSSGGSTSC